MSRLIVDDDLGHIEFHSSIRAKHITVRFRGGKFRLTHPPQIELHQIEQAIIQMKPRLMKMKTRDVVPSLFFSPDSTFNTFSFKLHISIGNSPDRYTAIIKDGIFSIECPLDCRFDQEQQRLRSIIESGFRFEAKRIFPKKVSELASIHGFVFKDIKINKSRTRWGSCSSSKSINLSYFCMLLPEYLIDFVILHELCHTVEMNHSERFWLLLNRVTGNKAKALTNELKSYASVW